MIIFRILINSSLRRYFDYLSPLNFTAKDLKKMQPGMRLRVPFGSREIIGIFLEHIDHTDIDPIKLKRVIAVIDTEPLFSKSIFQLCVWANDYYHHILGDVLFNALPKLLRDGAIADRGANLPRRKKNVLKEENLELGLSSEPVADLALTLNSAQEKAITTILQQQNQAKVFLLDGVTGSGKTEVYLRVIEAILKEGKQALVLVPEISLTPQTLARFQKRFPLQKIAIFHSRLNDRERLLAWFDAREGTADIVIGTRSALFTPLARPGIIVLDEEHDLSFKQQSGLRYSARDLAVVRSKMEVIPLILGSATPSLESLANARQGRYLHLTLPERVGGALPPEICLLDVRKQKLKSGLSLRVIQTIQEHVAQNEQILIFVNRRGYAPSLLCHQCGWVANCEHCDVKLTLHQKDQYLRCHHCDAKSSIPEKCPQCGCNDLMPCGVGTERLETALKKLFPHVNIARIDRDTTSKKGALQKVLQDMHTGDCQILIGTQILTKGHHFPDVTLVVILNADGGLFSPDFRASEYLAQLITQVAGRSGRALKPGAVYIQTHYPEHQILLSLMQNGYAGFAQIALNERQQAALPPFAYLGLVRAEGKNRDQVYKFLEMLRDYGKQACVPKVSLFGPVAAVIERKGGAYCAQLLLQSQERKYLHHLVKLLLDYSENLKEAKRLRWSLEIDPVDVNS